VEHHDYGSAELRDRPDGEPLIMAAVLLTPPPVRWVCPNCPVEAVTPGNTPNRYHECRGLAGITAPMVPAGSRSRVLSVVREDYVGSEIVQYDDNGRPVMAVITERPDGSNDVTVLAPTAAMRVAM
jgi:hypothetical protein